MFKVVKIKTQEQRHSEYHTIHKIKVAPFSCISIVEIEQVSACWEESCYKHVPSTTESHYLFNNDLKKINFGKMI